MRALRGIEQSTPGLRPLLRHVRESLRVLIFSDVPAGLSSRDNSSTRSGDSGSGLGVKHRPYRDVVERTLRRLEEVCGARDDAVARAEATEAAVNTLRTTLVACNQKEVALIDQVRRTGNSTCARAADPATSLRPADPPPPLRRVRSPRRLSQLREKRMQCEQLAEAVVAEANRRKAEKQQFEATVRRRVTSTPYRALVRLSLPLPCCTWWSGGLGRFERWGGTSRKPGPRTLLQCVPPARVARGSCVTL